MYARIVVPLDGSAFAEEILPFSLSLGRTAGSALVLLRAVADDDERRAAEAYIEGLARPLDAEGKVLIVGDSGVADAICREAAEPNTLVTMTTHGRSGILEVLLGSVAQPVLRQVEGPVLVYRPKGPGSGGASGQAASIRHILLPLDGSDVSEGAIPYAAGLTVTLNARITVVQVVASTGGPPPAGLKGDIREDSYVRSRASQILSEYGVDADWEVLHGDPASAICEYAGDARDAVLAMSSHGRSGVPRAILGSVAGECVRRAGVPVLIQYAH